MLPYDTSREYSLVNHLPNCQSPSLFLLSHHCAINTDMAKGLVLIIYTCFLLVSFYSQTVNQPLYMFTPPCLYVQTGVCTYNLHWNVTFYWGYLRSSTGLLCSLSSHQSCWPTLSTTPSKDISVSHIQYPTYCKTCWLPIQNIQTQNLTILHHLHHFEPTLATISSFLDFINAPCLGFTFLFIFSK